MSNMPLRRYCPDCGACVAADDAHCFACNAALASCSVDPYRHSCTCSHCGANLTGRESVCTHCGIPRFWRPSPLARCRCRPDGPTMVTWILLDPTIRVHSCPECGGSFVERACWLALVRYLQPRQVDPIRLPYEVKRRPLGERYGERDDRRPCPVCREPTERRNLAGISGVLAQHCVFHGFFFPVGQLHAAMEFVRTGGMTLARARGLSRAGEIPDSRRP